MKDLTLKDFAEIEKWTKLHAKKYANYLFENDLLYHIDDDADDILWERAVPNVTKKMKKMLNKISDNMFDNKVRSAYFKEGMRLQRIQYYKENPMMIETQG